MLAVWFFRGLRTKLTFVLYYTHTVFFVWQFLIAQLIQFCSAKISNNGSFPIQNGLDFHLVTLAVISKIYRSDYISSVRCRMNFNKLIKKNKLQCVLTVAEGGPFPLLRPLKYQIKCNKAHNLVNCIYVAPILCSHFCTNIRRKRKLMIIFYYVACAKLQIMAIVAWKYLPCDYQRLALKLQALRSKFHCKMSSHIVSYTSSSRRM